MTLPRRNVVVNVIGSIIPMLAAVVAMPLLLHGMGAARMGLFTLALGLFGFSGIFDLGLGRALTREVAFHAQAGESPAHIAGLFRSGLLVVCLLGVLWGAIICVARDWLVAQIPHLDPALRGEASASLLIIGALVPVALASASLVGALEGLQEFWRSNTIRVPVGVATYLLPALTSRWSGDLVWVVATLAAVRAAGMCGQFVAVSRRLPLRAPAQLNPLPTAPMWRYTGWLTVSNVIGPLMVYGDRYYLATVLPPAGVAQYTVPMDTLFRGTSLPSAALAAAFPALARSDRSRDQAGSFLNEVLKVFSLAWLAPLVVMGLMLPDALRLWLGVAFSQEILLTSRLILAGVLVNGFALVPFTLLQAVGRSDITAKLHLVELPIFVLALAWWVPHLGATGAALAWCLRVALDALLLLYMTWRCFPHALRSLGLLGALAFLGASFVVACVMLPTLAARLVGALTIAISALVALHRMGGIRKLMVNLSPTDGGNLNR